jgi:hypothetical protein
MAERSGREAPRAGCEPLSRVVQARNLFPRTSGWGATLRFDLARDDRRPSIHPDRSAEHPPRHRPRSTRPFSSVGVPQIVEAVSNPGLLPQCETSRPGRSYEGLVLVHGVERKAQISPEQVACSLAEVGLFGHRPTALLDKVHCLDSVDDQPEILTTADVCNALKAHLPLVACGPSIIRRIEVHCESTAGRGDFAELVELVSDDCFVEIHRDSLEDEVRGACYIETSCNQCVRRALFGQIGPNVYGTRSRCAANLVPLRCCVIQFDELDARASESPHSAVVAGSDHDDLLNSCFERLGDLIVEPREACREPGQSYGLGTPPVWDAPHEPDDHPH